MHTSSQRYSSFRALTLFNICFQLSRFSKWVHYFLTSNSIWPLASIAPHSFLGFLIDFLLSILPWIPFQVFSGRPYTVNGEPNIAFVVMSLLRLLGHSAFHTSPCRIGLPGALFDLKILGAISTSCENENSYSKENSLTEDFREIQSPSLSPQRLVSAWKSFLSILSNLNVYLNALLYRLAPSALKASPQCNCRPP